MGRPMEAEVPKAGHMMDLGLAGCLLRLKVSASAFVPSLTTRILADRLAVTEGCSLLDMGCGVGPLAIVAAKKGACPVYAVGIMEEAGRRGKAIEALERAAELKGDDAEVWTSLAAVCRLDGRTQEAIGALGAVLGSPE